MKLGLGTVFLGAVISLSISATFTPLPRFCARIVKGPPYFDHFQGQPLSWALAEFPGAKLFYLGSGNAAIVYRVIPAIGDPFVIKYYREPSSTAVVVDNYMTPDARARFSPPVVPIEKIVRDFDVKVNQILDASVKAGANIGFKIPGVLALEFEKTHEGKNNRTYYCMKYLRDVRGRSVLSILEDPSIEPEFKAFIRGEYEQRLALYRSFLELRFKATPNPSGLEQMRRNRDTETVMKYPLLHMKVSIEEAEGSDHTMTVKADGVIVESDTLDFYLNDVD